MTPRKCGGLSLMWLWVKKISLSFPLSSPEKLFGKAMVISYLVCSPWFPWSCCCLEHCVAATGGCWLEVSGTLEDFLEGVRSPWRGETLRRRRRRGVGGGGDDVATHPPYSQPFLHPTSEATAFRTRREDKNSLSSPPQNPPSPPSPIPNRNRAWPRSGNLQNIQVDWNVARARLWKF